MLLASCISSCILWINEVIQPTSVTVGLAWPRILPFFRAGVCVCVCVCVCCMCMSDHPWIIDMEDRVGAQKEEVH